MANYLDLYIGFVSVAKSAIEAKKVYEMSVLAYQ